MSVGSSTGTVDLAELRAQVRGTVLGPQDDGYDERRTVEMANHDERPAAVVSVGSVDDVVAAVRFAAAHDLPVAVRSGGHSTAGYGSVEGGLVVDVRGLTGVEVDAAAGRATAGAGVTAGEFGRALGEHGLVVGLGDTGTVGLSGLTLGGGLGLLSRLYGTTADSLVAAEVVTADGVVRHVDAEHEPELFWALRGGGANVGVVTRLTFATHELGPVLGGMVVLPLERAVLRHVLDLATTAPREAGVIVTTTVAPPMPFLPAEVHGKAAMVMLAHAGPEDEAQRFLDALTSVAEPLAVMVRRGPYAAMLEEPEGPPFRPYAAVGTYLADAVPDEAIDRIVDYVLTTEAMMRLVQLRPVGGAVADVPADATAYAHRDAAFVGYVAAMSLSPDDVAANQAKVDATLEGMPGRRDGAYVNFLPRTGAAGVRAAYPGPTWDRLARVKAAYDPGNLFRVNHNVPPAG